MRLRHLEDAAQREAAAYLEQGAHGVVFMHFSTLFRVFLCILV